MDRRDRPRLPVKRWGRRGSTLVVSAVALLALFGAAALTVDVGHVIVEKQRLQQICDMAALEGGKHLPASPIGIGTALSDAETAARQYADANGAGTGGVTLDVQATGGSGGSPAQLRVTATETVPMTFARVLGYDSHDIQATAVAQGQSHWVWVPLAIDSQTLSPGLEADLGFKNCASGHFWRVVVPNATDADFEGLVRDGVASRLNIGDSVDLDPNTEAVKTEIENAVNSRLQAAPGSAGTDPSIIQVPIVADMTNIDFYAPRKSVKVVGFASLRLIRVDDTQLKLRYVSPSSPPAPSGSSGPLVQ